MTEVPSVSGFRLYFGNIFSSPTVYVDSFIQSHLTDCMVEVQQSIFGRYYLRALYYLTAHYVTVYTDVQTKAGLSPAGTTVFASVRGVIESTSVGDLSLSKSMPDYTKTSDDKFLASTIFGQEFIRLRNKMSKGPLISTKKPSGIIIC